MRNQPSTARLWSIAWLSCAVWALAGCSHVPQTRVSGDVALKVKWAWVDGRKVEYITTDASDPEVARAQGVNHVPRLADALVKVPGGKSLLERVYAFPGQEQAPVFQSAPLPAGPANADRAYSPLWRMVKVTWAPKATVRPLTSEEDILKAEDQGVVTVTVTNVVLNCPVLRTFETRPSH